MCYREDKTLNSVLFYQRFCWENISGYSYPCCLNVKLRSLGQESGNYVLQIESHFNLCLVCFHTCSFLWEEWVTTSPGPGMSLKVRHLWSFSLHHILYIIPITPPNLQWQILIFEIKAHSLSNRWVLSHQSLPWSWSWTTFLSI